MDLKDKNIIMLMNDISKLFHNEMKRRSNEDSKMVTYRPILHMLDHHDGCNQLDIVNYTMLKAPTISVTLRNMEYDGLIRREESKEDKRNVLIFLTEKGKQQNERIHQLLEEIKDEILENVTSEEQEFVKEILIKIINKLEEFK